jgi:opacity protein-like surface antigen
MCGCCNGNAGSPWGFGWLAGFRYINFTEDWLFTTDTTETVFDNDATELNYAVDLDNNLIGFQMGGGISYCVTNALSAYATAKFGLYNNHIEQTQRVFGPLGNATINNGPFATSDYVIDAEDDDIAFVGQFDAGARWALNESWSINAGYRLVALSGVAIAETNVAQGNFQNVLGISDTQSTGSFIMHGVVLGATYCW